MFNLFKYPVLIKHESEWPGFVRWWLLCIGITCELISVVLCKMRICMQRFPCLYTRTRSLARSLNNALNVKMATPKIYCFVSICSRSGAVRIPYLDTEPPDGQTDRQTPRRGFRSLWRMFTYFISMMDQKTSHWNWKLYVCAVVCIRQMKKISSIRQGF